MLLLEVTKGYPIKIIILVIDRYCGWYSKYEVLFLYRLGCLHCCGNGRVDTSISIQRKKYGNGDKRYRNAGLSSYSGF